MFSVRTTFGFLFQENLAMENWYDCRGAIGFEKLHFKKHVLRPHENEK